VGAVDGADVGACLDGLRVDEVGVAVGLAGVGGIVEGFDVG